MNRTLLVQTLAAGPPVAGGRISVLTGFAHPLRGAVRCPAAPAFAAGLAERLRTGAPALGRDVLLEADLDAAGHTRAAVTVAVSYLHRDGQAGGLAAALPAEDDAARDVVLRALCEWTGVMRTRSVLVAEPPACANAATAAAWCPHRRTAHASVLDFTDRGDALALITEPGNAFAEQLAADARDAGGRAEIVHEPSASALEDVNPEALSFVIVPGTRVEAAVPILLGLRRRFPRLRGQHPDEYCYGRSDWYETVRSVASASECVLVLTDPAEPSDPIVAEVLGGLGVPGVRVTDPADLRPDQLAHGAIGLIPTGSATAGKRLAETLDLLGGLGPLSARRRVTRTEPLRPSHPAARAPRPTVAAVEDATGWWGSGQLP